ncbi:MAG: hypothetical protein HY689_09695 [Chloroflexi bacterium]|nr:hypothetical protein [Chloroflexota bacterium]
MTRARFSCQAGRYRSVTRISPERNTIPYRGWCDLPDRQATEQRLRDWEQRVREDALPEFLALFAAGPLPEA